MAKYHLKAGTTSQLAHIFIQDSSLATGAGLTGLTNASSGLTAYYWIDGATTATAISLANGTLGTWSSGGFKEMDATNLPGLYELGLPNAVLAAAGNAVVMLKGATNMVVNVSEIQCIPVPPDLSVANAVETGTTLQQALRIAIAALAGKLSGGATATNTVRNVGDTRDSIVYTVDSSGNRSSVTLNN